ncbi:MAG: sigma-54-dependent transcriptional regulator [bacterium]
MPGRAAEPGPRPRVLVALREGATARALVPALERAGFEPLTVRDHDGAERAFGEGPVEAVVAETRAPRLDGLVLTDLALRASPWACVVLLSTPATRAVALEAVRRGAYEYLPASVEPAAIVAALRQGIDRQHLARRVAEMEHQLDRNAGVEALVGRSRAIQRVRETVRRAAAVRATVCLEGEPGTGKSLIARAIHLAGPRRERPFVRVRCAALPPALLELELFGTQGSPGALERADRGTLHLEGVEHLSSGAQLRLVAFLAEGRFAREGESTARRADVRTVVSTEVSLETLARERRLHPELRVHFDVLRVLVPALRDRLDDLPALVEVFVRDANREHRRRVPGVTAGVLDRFARHAWPGNVRELRETVRALVATRRGRGPVDVADLPAALRGDDSADTALVMRVGMTLDSVERRLVEATLAHTGGDKPRAAAMLGIGLRTLYRRLDDWAGGAAPVRSRPRPARPRRG